MKLFPETLKTERLSLRPYKESDCSEILRYSSDPEWSRFLPSPALLTEKHVANYIAEFLNMKPEEGIGYAIEFQGQVVGGIRVRLFLESFRAELGYSIAPTHWGNGFATEASSRAIDTCFNSLQDLNRISANTDPRNIGSVRVLEKIGMTREGILRENRVISEKLVDELWYGILRREWHAYRQNGPSGQKAS